MFGLIGKITAQPGQRERLIEQLMKAASSMDDVPGCRQYIVHASREEDDAIWVTEIWDDEESHRASLSMEGTRELIQESMPLIAGVSNQVRLTPIGGKGME